MSAPTAVRAASLTDVGKVREANEDACFAGAHVFAVADGLGGHRAGEVASTLALESIATLDGLDARRASERLGDAVRKANRSVSDRASQNDSMKGMGTTMTVVALDGYTAHLAHVGDSRCYLIRGDSITRLSRDHTLVARMVDEGKITSEQADQHPQRSILTRALGAERDVEVDEARFSLIGGDRLLLCSDGLTGVLSDEEIQRVAASGSDLAEICARLVSEANARGGPDNITVVLVDVEGASGDRAAPVGRARTRRTSPSFQRHHISARPFVWVAIVATLIVGGLVAVRTVTNRSYYVGIKDGKVAIFQGVPVDVGGVSLSHVQEPTVIPTESVAPYYIERLLQGVRATSLQDARRIVNEQIPPAPGSSLSDIVPEPTPSPS